MNAGQVKEFHGGIGRNAQNLKLPVEPDPGVILFHGDEVLDPGQTAAELDFRHIGKIAQPLPDHIQVRIGYVDTPGVVVYLFAAQVDPVGHLQVRIAPDQRHQHIVIGAVIRFDILKLRKIPEHREVRLGEGVHLQRDQITGTEAPLKGNGPGDLTFGKCLLKRLKLLRRQAGVSEIQLPQAGQFLQLVDFLCPSAGKIQNGGASGVFHPVDHNIGLVKAIETDAANDDGGQQDQGNGCTQQSPLFLGHSQIISFHIALYYLRKFR